MTNAQPTNFARMSPAGLFDAELTTNESYVLLHRPEDVAHKELQKFTHWILNEFRVA